jgi:N-methylhydantoinase A
MSVDHRSSQIVLGIDVGGTFTDVIALDKSTGQIIATLKVPSTPSAPQKGAIEGVDRFLARTGKPVSAVFHGTTVGTNTLIEKRGGRTALIATKGFADVVELRRQARPRLYDLNATVSPPLVPHELRIEVDERTLHDGTHLKSLTDAEVNRVAELVARGSVDAVAVSLLHSYASGKHEEEIGRVLRQRFPDLFVTLSSDVTREFREFERTSTAVVNAYIGPTVAQYLRELEHELEKRSSKALYIVKSNGGLTSVANARRFPVHLIESGPAAGVIAVAALGASEGIENLIAFDMGGTTAKAGVVVNGQPRLSTEFYADQFVDGEDMGGYPIKSPVIDLVEIGAGGGSIGHLDSANVLKVGPESTGADPGPASYGHGGKLPAITDAHVALGHIASDGFGSEDIVIDVAAARSAINTQIAEKLGWSVERAAWGMLDIATANMAEMVRFATLRRGLDPRDFVLVAFGGGGPLHAMEIAAEVGIPKVLIPPLPGLFSAVGTVLGKMRHDLVQTFLRPTKGLSHEVISEGFARLLERADDLISAEISEASQKWTFVRAAELRYQGQLFEIEISVGAGEAPSGSELETAFRTRYRETYGYELENNQVEIVNLRLVASAPVWGGVWPETGEVSAGGPGERTRRILAADGTGADIPVIPRSRLKPGDTRMGPLIIEDFGATIRVTAGQTLLVRPSGVIEITIKAAQ